MKFEKKAFQNATVTLDGNEYIDCDFQNCVLLHCGGPYSIDEKTRFGVCSFGIGGEAQNTLKFLRFVRAASPASFQELLDQGPQPVLVPTAKPTTN